MASRKRRPDSPQIGLTFAGPSLPTPGPDLGTLDPDLVPASLSAGTPLVQASADLGSRYASEGFPDGISIPHIAPADGPEAGTNLDYFDDYDDQEIHDDVPRLRLVDPPRQVAIIVEAVGNGFEVSRLRDNGTTCAAVMYTRDELIELQGRIAAALEM